MTSEHKRLAWDAGDDFEGACDVRIGFKTTQHESRDEHWMNKLSVRWTRHEDDIDPGGRISHAEIMLQVQPNVWRRWSIAKMTRITKSDGRYKWMPGTVHCKRVDVMNDDYVYIKLFVHRNQQTRMYQFLMSQVGAGFNMSAYCLNFVMPFGLFGTRSYYPGIERKHRKWFCTELITVALQASGLASMRNHVACRMSPNALYRACSAMNSAMPASNPGRIVHIKL